MWKKIWKKSACFLRSFVRKKYEINWIIFWDLPPVLRIVLRILIGFFNTISMDFRKEILLNKYVKHCAIFFFENP